MSTLNLPRSKLLRLTISVPTREKSLEEEEEEEEEKILQISN